MWHAGSSTPIHWGWGGRFPGADARIHPGGGGGAGVTHHAGRGGHECGGAGGGWRGMVIVTQIFLQVPGQHLHHFFTSLPVNSGGKGIDGKRGVWQGGQSAYGLVGGSVSPNGRLSHILFGNA